MLKNCCVSCRILNFTKSVRFCKIAYLVRLSQMKKRIDVCLSSTLNSIIMQDKQDSGSI